MKINNTWIAAEYFLVKMYPGTYACAQSIYKMCKNKHQEKSKA